MVKEIYKKYKALIPTLNRVRIWSDGGPHHYKLRHNFQAIEASLRDHKFIQHHEFFAPYHGHGPIDNVGRIAKMTLQQGEKYEEVRLNNFVDCFHYCVDKMGFLSQSVKRGLEVIGDFACNGVYEWRCLGDMANEFRHSSFDGMISPREMDCNPIRGSLNLFSYHGDNPEPEQLNYKFVPCFCVNCRNHKTDQCLSLPQTGPTIVTPINLTTRLHTIYNLRSNYEKSDDE